MPVIDVAHKLNCHVITCDYLPENYAHRFSDEYHNVSIIDKAAVLKLAQDLNIDGIMSFACDPGVVSAAYVAEKMDLPFQCSYEAASILQDKGLFRNFLADNHFNVPHAKRYENVATIPEEDYEFFNWPVIVKPVDSAGSKGVSKVESPEQLASAIQTALNSSLSKSFIIEDFLTFEGYHSSADPFTVDGKLKFVSYSDQLFDPTAENPYTPAMIIWQSSMKQCYQDYLTNETQRLMDLLGMRNGIYNIETCVATDGKPYIMEVSPRGGGCKIAELQQMAYGVDLIGNEVRKAVGMSLTDIEQTSCDGYWCEMVVHANIEQEGVLDRIEIAPEIMNKYVKVVDFSVSKGDLVKPFTGANMSLGDIFLRFDSRDELDEIMSFSNDWLRVKLQ